MAKLKVSFGQLRGKIGGMVYRHDTDGMTVVSEYNPSPANPRTVAQTAQRGKMNLAGQISKLTPYSAIAGFDSKRRAARSRFVSMMLKNITSESQQGGGSRSMLAANKLILSEGRAAILTLSATFDSATNDVVVSIANPIEGQSIMGVRVVTYFTDSNEYRFCSVNELANQVEAATQTVNVPVPASIVSAEGAAQVYVVPIFGDDARAVTVYQQGVFNNEAVSDYENNVNRVLSMLNAFGASAFVDGVPIGE